MSGPLSLQAAHLFRQSTSLAGPHAFESRRKWLGEGLADGPLERRADRSMTGFKSHHASPLMRWSRMFYRFFQLLFCPCR